MRETTAIAVKISIGKGIFNSAIYEERSAVDRPTRLQIPNAVPHLSIGNKNGVDTKQVHIAMLAPNFANNTNEATKATLFSNEFWNINAAPPSAVIK